MARIQTQRCDFDLQFQLKINNIRQLFEISDRSMTGPKLYSDPLGPGIYLYLQPTLTRDDKQVCSLGISSRDIERTISLCIDGEVVARSLQGERYFTRSFRTVFEKGKESSMTWPDFMTHEFYEKNQTMRWENAIVFEINIRSFAPMPILRTKPALDTLHKTLTCSKTLDTILLVFATRSRSGRLSRPQRFLVSRKALEDCDQLEHRHTLDDLVRTFGGIEMNQQQRETNLSNLVAGNMDYDSDFEDDAEMIEEKGRVTGQTDMLTQAERKYAGSVIVLRDIPARTWEALIYYLQTGFIVFAPLGSHGKLSQKLFVDKYHQTTASRPLPVSCRSIYRVASTLGLRELKKQALDHLEAQLTPGIVLDELFSPFTSRHDEVMKLEFKLIEQWWPELQVSSLLTQKMEEIASGHFPHASIVMAELWKRMSARNASRITR